MNDNWKEEVSSKLVSIGCVVCEQAQMLAEYAGEILQSDLPDKKQRISWLVAEARRHGFNAKFTITGDEVQCDVKQRWIRFTAKS